MTHRQSKKPPTVPTDDAKARAARIGERIRQRMREMGLIDDRGKLEVQELARQIAARAGREPRWQTVQQWVLGRAAPRDGYDLALAEVLGMTLDELAGIALEQEPDTEAWRSFKASPAYATATDDELRELRRRTALRGRSFVPGYYEMELAMLRTMTRPD